MNTSSKYLTDFSDIQIHDVGSDPNSEICEGFSLDESQIAEFFSQAEIISFKQLHDQFDYLPCFVKGYLTRRGQTCEYTIRAGATAEVNCSDQDHFFYACRACDNLFIAK